MDTKLELCWSPQMPQLRYVPDQSDGCDHSFLYSRSGEFSAKLIPDCVKILVLYLGG